MKKQKLLNKIKNLLDLAEDKNSRHEAEAASKKAQALIMKYNIEEAELRGGEEASIEEVKYELYKLKKYSEGTWLRNLFFAVAKFNFCEIIIQKVNVPEYKKRQEIIFILGEKDNIELVKFLSEQLCHRLRSIEKQNWDEYNGPDNRRTFKRGFLKGASRGVYLQLESQQEQFAEDESTAIVISNKNEKVQKYMEQEYGNLGKARSGHTTSASGYNRGVEAGKNVNVNPGARGKNGAKLLNWQDNWWDLVGRNAGARRPASYP